MSRQALITCIQVVASIPPRSTYASMKTPAISTDAQNGIPASAWNSTPAPTI